MAMLSLGLSPIGYFGKEPAVKSISVKEAAALLRQGRPVIFPTDTVYGIGLSPAFASSPEALFRLKRRDGDKPVAWLVAAPEALDEWGADVPDWAHLLAQSYWPGALTLVVRASDRVPPAFASPQGTIGLRMPASSTALALMRALGAPLATTSANISGCPAVSRALDLDHRLLADAFLVAPENEEEAAPSDSLASTVVDCTGSRPVVLRQGPVRL